MIPNNTKNATVSGNLGDTEDFEMQISAKATVHLMSLLTDLYSDEELACIREYSTNAWDSHLQAGVTRPIEVSTPSALSPFLRIKDYGVGMDKATIRDVYSQYGESNKRTETTTNGSMGIGGKCALAYTTQFTVVGIKDGIATTVLVRRTETGAGVMSILDESKTDEPNGVEIMIPGKEYNDFKRKAENFFQFWKKGTVLLNGVDPTKELTKVSDRIFLHDGDVDYVFMGNVPYPIERRHSISMGMSDSVVAYVTMNSADEVVFTPNREALNYNPITTNALDGLREEFNEYIVEYLNKSINSAPTFREAWKKYTDLRRTYGHLLDDVEYKGEKIVKDMLFDETDQGNSKVYRALTWHPSRSRNSVRTQDLSMSLLDNATLIITGYKGGGSVSSDHKRRIKEYCAANSLTYSGGYYRSVVLVSQKEIPGGSWTSEFETYAWADIMKATRKERESTASGFSYGERYDVWNPTTNSYDIVSVEEDAKVYYFTPADTYVSTSLANGICEVEPEAVIVCANANRHGKIKRLYPNALRLNVHQWQKDIGDAQFEKLSADDKETLIIQDMYEESYYYKHYGVSYRAAYLRVDSIDDPEYAEVIRKYHRTVNKGEFLNVSPDYNKWLAANKGNTPIKFKDERYPLMDWDNKPDATLEYINLMYNTKKGN